MNTNNSALVIFYKDLAQTEVQTYILRLLYIRCNMLFYDRDMTNFNFCTRKCIFSTVELFYFIVGLIFCIYLGYENVSCVGNFTHLIPRNWQILLHTAQKYRLGGINWLVYILVLYLAETIHPGQQHGPEQKMPSGQKKQP